MSNLISNCLLCDEHSLHAYGKEDAQVMQCVNCGYTTTTNFKFESGELEKNTEYQKLNAQFKKWLEITHVETGGRFWIPTIMALPTGMLYPVDSDGEMKWAYAPMIDIPEEDRKDYPDGNGSFFKQKYDNDNSEIFDKFVDSMLFLTKVKEKSENGSF